MQGWNKWKDEEKIANTWLQVLSQTGDGYQYVSPSFLTVSLPRLPLGGKRGYDAFSGQPQQLRFIAGVNANLSGIL